LRTRRGHLGLRNIALSARLIEVGLAGEVLRTKSLEPIERRLCRRERGLGAPELRLGRRGLCPILLDRGPEQRGIDLREDIAFFHDRIEIDEDFGDASRNLRPDLHLRDRLNGAR
jgi:hypothetical protein